MNYATIRNYDIANGEGVRTSLFVSGCNFHCPNCFNPEAQNFEYGERFTGETAEKIMTMISDSTISGLSILGGDPLCQDTDGMIALSTLCRRQRQDCLAMDRISMGGCVCSAVQRFTAPIPEVFAC